MMKTVDIVEVFVSAIEEKIIKEWKHEGVICGCSSEHINFELDGKEYAVKITEVKEGEHWSEKVKKEAKDYPPYLDRPKV